MYRLKHIPTGLYYQPHTHRGNNLSKKGKIYQSNTHGLSTAFKYAEHYKDLETRIFTIYVTEDSLIHKQTKDILIYRNNASGYKNLATDTRLKDWIKEEI